VENAWHINIMYFLDVDYFIFFKLIIPYYSPSDRAVRFDRESGVRNLKSERLKWAHREKGKTRSIFVEYFALLIIKINGTKISIKSFSIVHK